MIADFAKKLFTRVTEVTFYPKRFWVSQKGNNETCATLWMVYFIPLMVLVAISVFLGEFFRNSNFYTGFALLKAMREILLFVLQFFIAAFFTNELIKTFDGEKNSVLSKKLVLFSLTPFLLVSMVTGLFPFLYVADILGLYGFYIFWLGASELLDIPEQKKGSYILITIVVNFFVFSFFSIFLSKLLTAYF